MSLSRVSRFLIFVMNPAISFFNSLDVMVAIFIRARLLSSKFSPKSSSYLSSTSIESRLTRFTAPGYGLALIIPTVPAAQIRPRIGAERLQHGVIGQPQRPGQGVRHAGEESGVGRDAPKASGEPHRPVRLH